MSAARLAALGPARAAVVANLFRGCMASVHVRNFVRILGARHADAPLGFSHGPSRFSPLPPSLGTFGVLYLAADLATGAYETVVRDRFDLEPNRVLRPADYAAKVAVNVSSAHAALDLLDLTDGNAVRHGVPTDVVKQTSHSHGQQFSEFVHRQLPGVDGIMYLSRLTERLCVAIYDRAVSKLASSGPVPLPRTLLHATLSPWNITVR